MLNSNEEKITLSGWLKKNGNAEYKSSLKLQKFLFFYESFKKASGDKADFSYLKGWINGPIFSTVYGDYTYERILFDQEADLQLQNHYDMIDIEKAQKAHFLTSILSVAELSELTHKMHIWSAKKDRILESEPSVPLNERDFDEHDIKFVTLLNRLYSSDVINNTVVVHVGEYYFLFSKEDSVRLTEKHYDVLKMLAEKEKLTNPVYVDIDEEGRLIID